MHHSFCTIATNAVPIALAYLAGKESSDCRCRALPLRTIAYLSDSAVELRESHLSSPQPYTPSSQSAAPISCRQDVYACHWAYIRGSRVVFVNSSSYRLHNLGRSNARSSISLDIMSTIPRSSDIKADDNDLTKKCSNSRGFTSEVADVDDKKLKRKIDLWLMPIL